MIEKKYLSVRRIATALDYDPITVRTLIKEGQLPAIAIRRSRSTTFRVTEADFETFLRDRATTLIRGPEAAHA